MPRNTFSQVGGLASNPMNGVHNILLQPATGDDAGQNLTMSRKDLLKILDEIADPNTETTEIHIKEVRKATEYFEDLIDDLNALYGALQNNTDSVATKDPISGETYKTGPQLAKELASRIRQMDSKETKSSKVFNFAKYAAAKGKAREEKTKKKTRGNPFRVLMGQVGKMLDHGISKKDIIRYIGKKNMWNDETIGKAVDVGCLEGFRPITTQVRVALVIGKYQDEIGFIIGPDGGLKWKRRYNEREQFGKPDIEYPFGIR